MWEVCNGHSYISGLEFARFTSDGNVDWCQHLCAIGCHLQRLNMFKPCAVVTGTFVDTNLSRALAKQYIQCG